MIYKCKYRVEMCLKGRFDAISCIGIHGRTEFVIHKQIDRQTEKIYSTPANGRS